MHNNHNVALRAPPLPPPQSNLPPLFAAGLLNPAQSQMPPCSLCADQFPQLVGGLKLAVAVIEVELDHIVPVRLLHKPLDAVLARVVPCDVGDILK
jgi:hypothetical protein